jgi:hypothetical protein
MGVGRRGAALTGDAAIERKAAANKVDGDGAEEAANRVSAAGNFWASAGRQKAEPQLARERQGPFVVGQSSSGFTVRQRCGGCAKVTPMLPQSVPRLCDDLVQALALGQGIVLRLRARQL